VTNYSDTTGQLFDTVTTALDRASLSAARIGGSAKPSLKETGFSLQIPDLNMGEPPKFSDLLDGSDSAGVINAEINDQVDEWLAKYFPSINSGFQNVPDDYLIGVVSQTKPYGADSTVLELVWQKQRDRAYRTSNSEKQTLYSRFTSAGFTLPPGALVDAVAQSEQRATDSILDANRDVALKDADIKVDILKHAVGIAASLKQGILNTSAEFFRTYYKAYDLDVDKMRTRASAYNSYYQALSTYYGVEVSMEGLRLRAGQTTAEVDNNIDRNRISVYAEDGAAGAHAQASRGFADIAASASTAAGTLVAEIETGGLA